MNGLVFADAARQWIGTPYVHQASRIGAGCDCLGLLRGVWREVLGAEPEAVPAYSYDWSEPQGEERLWAAAARNLMSKDRMSEAVGDVLLFRMRDGSVAKHLGLQGRVGENASLIHAYTGHGVVESIRCGQVPFGTHSRSALTKVFASSISLRIIAVRATF